METDQGHSRKGLVCLYEFMGQVFFMYAVLVSGGSGSDTWGITGPLALFAIVNIWGGVSGGHFNPAVTLGVFVRERESFGENFCFMVSIIISQLCGALCGAGLAYLVLRTINNGNYEVLPANVPLLLPSDLTKEQIDSGDVTLDQNWSNFFMETVCTFVFVLFILHVTGKRTQVPDLGVWGLPAICLVLWALCNVDYFTGASFNPALAVGSTAFQFYLYPNNPDGVLTHYIWSYTMGAVCGGILAGGFYNAHAELFPDPHVDREDSEHGSHHGDSKRSPSHSPKPYNKIDSHQDAVTPHN